MKTCIEGWCKFIIFGLEKIIKALLVLFSIFQSLFALHHAAQNRWHQKSMRSTAHFSIWIVCSKWVESSMRAIKLCIHFFFETRCRILQLDWVLPNRMYSQRCTGSFSTMRRLEFTLQMNRSRLWNYRSKIGVR